MIRLLLLITLTLFITACSTVRVETDYDPDFAFATLSSFAVVHKYKAGDDTLTGERIIRAVTRNLRAKGYSEASKESADFLVLFHIDVKSKTQIDTGYEYVGMFPYYYGYPGMMVPVTHAYSYDEGNLLVDIVNPDGNKIVWRGVATDRIKSHSTPEQRSEYIRKVIDELLMSFPTAYHKEVR